MMSRVSSFVPWAHIRFETAVKITFASLGVLGAVLATFLRGLSNDVFFQVGLQTTIGLSAKNAILTVEFAKENFEKGMDLVESAKHAAAQRLRPILMTSFAFVMGVTPLALSNWGRIGRPECNRNRHHWRHAFGDGLAIFFVPLFFVATLRLTKQSAQLFRVGVQFVARGGLGVLPAYGGRQSHYYLSALRRRSFIVLRHIDQSIWELMGFYLNHHASRRFMRSRDANMRARKAFQGVIDRSRAMGSKRTAKAR